MTLKEIGKLIQQTRKQQQLTQTQLSTRLGISRATLSAIENGTINEIGIRKILALCNALGLELSLIPRTTRRPTLHHLLQEAQQQKIGKS